ncbi:hypothetical protein JCM9157_4865 [Halalkalibacter akibai JCM 9157]|uniref:Uncharacterized protein n=1 Tax=Halalkalibacter akibai (strain ATCC 43226 / DSM 21942 / CIP 109018 / JCM 9157 / 1139) TaxID=1236973 RepID=W4QZK0_HALA3|nr:hypothetical protein JCM9157_4865 [Halalkalibacter akibai JCM 9157]
MLELKKGVVVTTPFLLHEDEQFSTKLFILSMDIYGLKAHIKSNVKMEGFYEDWPV